MKLPNRNVDKNEIKRLQSPCRHYVRKKNILKVSTVESRKYPFIAG